MSTNLIGPDGRNYVLDNEDPAALNDALSQGFKQPIAPREKSDLESAADAAAAGVTGAVEGVTGGGLGAIAGLAARPDRSGFVDPAALQGKKELKRLQVEQPVASTVGELGGALASPLNAVGALVEGPRAATAAARLGQKVLGGAAVGSLYGAGNAVSEVANGDPDLTADKVLAHIGLGALLGSAGAGVGTALEEGVAGVLPKLARSAPGAQASLEEFANDRWLKAAGGIQSDLKKIPAAEHADVADAIRSHLSGDGLLPKSLDDAAESLKAERRTLAQDVIGEAGITDAGGLNPSMDQEQSLDAIKRAHDAHGQRMGKVLDAADAAGASPEYSKVAQRYADLEAGLNPAEKDLVAKPLADARRYLVELATGPADQQTFRALNDLKSTMQKDINWVADGTAKSGLKKQLVGILRDEIDTQLAPQIGPDLSKEWLAAKDEFAALSRAEDALGRKTSTGMDAIRALAKNAEEAPPSLRRLSAIEHASNLLKRGMEREHGNRWLSASDYLTGIGAGVMHGGPMGALTGLATSVAHKFMRENGAGVIAKLADRLAASPVLSTVAKSFAAQLPVTAPKLGTYAPALLNAAATSPEAALATHMTLARVDPAYAATAQLNGLTPEKPDEHLAALVRAHHIAEAGAAAAQTDKAIDRHIERIIKGLGAPSAPASMEKQDFGNKRMRRDTEASHEQRVKEVRELAADPNALLDRIAGNTAGVPPAVASAMSARAATAVQYLAQAAAVPPKGGPLAHEWTPTEADMHDFAQKLEVVERPLSVLEHAASGMMTEQQADALKAVYPGLAKDITDKMLMRLADAPTRVPYGARLVISILSGIDPDGTFSQEAIAANQNAISASGKKAAPGSSGSPSKHADHLSLAQRTATPSEKRDLAEE